MRRLNGQDAVVVCLGAALEATAAVRSEVVVDPMEQVRAAQAAAEEQGYLEGLSKGLADAEAQIARQAAAIEEELKRQHEKALAELETARRALTQLGRQIVTEVDRLERYAEEATVEAAYAGILKMLGECAADRNLMRELCLHAMSTAKQSPVALRVSTEDRELLGSGWGDVELIADARYARGQCALETRFGHYETGLDVRLEALKNAFIEGLRQHRSADT